GDELIGLESVLALLVSLGNHEELFQRQVAGAARTRDPHFRVVSDQDRGNGRPAYEVGRALVAENCMVTSGAPEHGGRSRFLREQPMPRAKIPAARTLAEVSADRGYIAYLWAGGIGRGRREHGMLALDLLGGADPVQRYQRAQLQRAGFIGDRMQSGDLFDV